MTDKRTQRLHHRIDPETYRLLVAVAEKYGDTLTTTVLRAIRELAKQENVT